MPTGAALQRSGDHPHRDPHRDHPDDSARLMSPAVTSGCLPASGDDLHGRCRHRVHRGWRATAETLLLLRTGGAGGRSGQTQGVAHRGQPHPGRDRSPHRLPGRHPPRGGGGTDRPGLAADRRVLRGPGPHRPTAAFADLAAEVATEVRLLIGRCRRTCALAGAPRRWGRPPRTSSQDDRSQALEPQAIGATFPVRHRRPSAPPLSTVRTPVQINEPLDKRPSIGNEMTPCRSAGP